MAIRAAHLAVHFLASHDRDLARVFGAESGDDLDKFDLCETEPGPHGVPLLGRCANRLVARRVALLDACGDHVCVLLEPIEVQASASFTPLRLADVGDLDAGHAAEETDTADRAGQLRGRFARPAQLRFSACFCFLTARFSFSDLPTFLVLGFCGVLPGIVAPLGWSSGAYGR